MAAGNRIPDAVLADRRDRRVYTYVSVAERTTATQEAGGRVYTVVVDFAGALGPDGPEEDGLVSPAFFRTCALGAGDMGRPPAGHLGGGCAHRLGKRARRVPSSALRTDSIYGSRRSGSYVVWHFRGACASACEPDELNKCSEKLRHVLSHSNVSVMSDEKRRSAHTD